MDIIEIIITVGALVIYYVISYKKQKAAKKTKQKQPADIFVPTLEDNDELEEEIDTEMATLESPYPPASHFEEKMTKNGTDFSYENLKTDTGTDQQISNKQTPTTPNSVVQEVEIEEENEINSTIFREEINKAIIYSEILKRTYN